MKRNLDQWLALLEKRHERAIDLGLERCGEVYERMGSPRPGQHITVVAGTNGKGSVIAFLSSIYRELGHSFAAYTSPHILRFNERLRIDDEEVSDAALVAAFEAVEVARRDVSLTYFEFTTLACLYIMHRAMPDYVLLEVGLGGRLDAVNLVDADLAIITPVGVDHREYLGGDRDTIGREKAGVLRFRQIVVLGDPDPPASLLARADDLGCKMFIAGRDFTIEREAAGGMFHMGQHAVTVPPPSLAGEHQWRNCASALAAATLSCPAIVRDAQAAQRGVKNARLEGRLQRAAADRRVMLDVGHNPLAASVVASFLEGEGTTDSYCVLAMLQDKDAEEVAKALSGVVGRWYCAGLGGSRGQDGAALARRVSDAVPQGAVRAFDSVDQALERARADAPVDSVILVFGSFQTVAQAMRALHLDSSS